MKRWCARRGINSSARSMMPARSCCATRICTRGSSTRTSTTIPTRPGCLRNSEPLLVNLVDTWALRPEATTAIPNLFLASDYVRTHTDLATMEGANEAARRAVNGLLDAVKFDGPRCELWPLHEPEILAPWRLHDAARYQAGLPWDDSLVQVAAHAIRGASPLLEQARPLLEQVCAVRQCRRRRARPARRRRGDVSELDTVDPTTMARRLVDVPTRSMC